MLDETPVLTVSELNRMARRALESQLPLVWVEGEVSNFMAAASGHWYFSLKDAGAQVRCVMFRGRNQLVGFTPTNGDRLELRALASLYEARGEFQLGIEAMRRGGAGRLFEAFLKLKAKLEAEGLFAAARKRGLPGLPRRIGVVTSPQAAALHDILTALARRMPGLPVVVYPTPVQGRDAGAQIAAAIRTASARAECDVLLVCRGGGSIEDLWAFNDEAVARAIAACTMPVVSGVGHETDFTLADFAADVRAPTPTAAAELASPLREKLLHQLDAWQHRLHVWQTRWQQRESQRLDFLAHRLVHPAERLRRQRDALARLTQRLDLVMRAQLAREQALLARFELRVRAPHTALAQQRQTLSLSGLRLQRAHAALLSKQRLELARLGKSLVHLDPQQVLARGYSIVQQQGGHIVSEVAKLMPGEHIRIRFHHGAAAATIDSLND